MARVAGLAAPVCFVAKLVLDFSPPHAGPMAALTAGLVIIVVAGQAWVAMKVVAVVQLVLDG